MTKAIEGTLDHVDKLQGDRSCLICDAPVAQGTVTLCGHIDIHTHGGILARFVCACRKCADMKD